MDGILDGTIPEEKRDYYLGIISGEVRRLSRLVNSLLETNLGLPYLWMIHRAVNRRRNERLQRVKAG